MIWEVDGHLLYANTMECSRQSLKLTTNQVAKFILTKCALSSQPMSRNWSFLAEPHKWFISYQPETNIWTWSFCRGCLKIWRQFDIWHDMTDMMYIYYIILYYMYMYVYMALRERRFYPTIPLDCHHLHKTTMQSYEVYSTSILLDKPIYNPNSPNIILHNWIYDCDWSWNKDTWPLNQGATSKPSQASCRQARPCTSIRYIWGGSQPSMYFTSADGFPTVAHPKRARNEPMLCGFFRPGKMASSNQLQRKSCIDDIAI